MKQIGMKMQFFWKGCINDDEMSQAKFNIQICQIMFSIEK